MTINTETRVAGPFEGNDSTTVFPFTFKVFDSDEVLVVHAVDSVESVLVLGADYGVTLNPDQNAAPGGSVTLLTGPLAADTTLTLTSALEYLQPLDLTNQGGFYPRVINNAFDRVTILIQQLFERLGRALVFPISDGPVGEMPGKAERAGAVLAFDPATGDPIVGPTIYAVDTVAAANEAIAIVASNIDDVNTVADNIVDVTNFADVYYGPSTTDPATRRDGSPLEEGDLYFNTESNRMHVYAGGAWHETPGGSVSVQNFSGDGVETEFLLNYAPETELVTQVFVAGIYQQKNTYEIGGVDGDLLIFSEAPPVGTDNIEVVVSSTVSSDGVLRADLADPALGNGASLVAGAAQVVESVAALKLLSKTAASLHAFVTGYYAPGDGGGGSYYLDAADTATADNGGTVIVAADGGRWKFAEPGAVTVSTFGAKNDGVSNNTPIVQAMLAAGVKRIVYGVGTWHHTASISIPQGVIVSFEGASFRTTILTANAGAGFALFNYQRASGQPGSVATFENMTFSWTGTARIANSAGIKYFGFSDAFSDNWFRTTSCAFYGFEKARHGKWAGQVYSQNDYFQSNRYSNYLERGASFWYMNDCMSFDATFVDARDTVGDAFSNGLVIHNCHNITATNENLFIEGWQSVYIDSCGFDLGSGGGAALWLKSCQDIGISKSFISSNGVATRNGITFDGSHSGKVSGCTFVNSTVGILFTAPALSLASKISVDGNKFDGQATNDIVMQAGVEAVKIVNNHFSKQMSRTGTDYEIFGNVAGVNNIIVGFNTFKGTSFAPILGAGSLVVSNIFGTKV